jgi:predicted AlkP superfamily phosphohydrolase/phosphomutase
MLAAGELPVLAGLASRRGRAQISSPAHIGSPAVWPTFTTGTEPQEHGHCFGAYWQPGRMRVAPDHPDNLDAWWRRVADSGRRVLTLDIPFAPLTGGEACIDVAEWGAHDRVRGALVTRPKGLAAGIERDPGRHPYARDVPPPGRPSHRYLAASAERALSGARLRGELALRLLRDVRPDVALIAFTEVHRASHLLWHTLEPGHPLFAETPPDGLGNPLPQLLREVDAQIGRLVEAAGRDAATIVFALHGMRPARGVPAVLGPLLEHLGFAAAPRGRALQPRDRARVAFAALKRNAPDAIRRAWRSTAPPAVQNRVAQPTLLLPLDWSRTRAFSLPTDQHGWVRINLAGREAEGIVPAGDYRTLCEAIEDALRAQRTEDGRRLVKDVVRIAEEHGTGPPATIPDLVVHWEDAAHDDPLRVAGSDLEVRPDGLRLTGKHTYDGWLVSAGCGLPGEVVAARDVHRLIAA